MEKATKYYGFEIGVGDVITMEATVDDIDGDIVYFVTEEGYNITLFPKDGVEEEN